jgi:microcin C transport system permease protein
MTISYIIKRLLLIVPTLFGIMLITFVLIQFAPGGPVEHILARINVQSPGHATLGLEPARDAK